MRMKLSPQTPDTLGARSDRLFTVDQSGTTTEYPFVVEWQIDRNNNCEAIPFFETLPPPPIARSFAETFDWTHPR